LQGLVFARIDLHEIKKIIIGKLKLYLNLIYLFKKHFLIKINKFCFGQKEKLQILPLQKLLYKKKTKKKTKFNSKEERECFFHLTLFSLSKKCRSPIFSFCKTIIFLLILKNSFSFQLKIFFIFYIKNKSFPFSFSLSEPILFFRKFDC
jgi:hypothetical protein